MKPATIRSLAFLAAAVFPFLATPLAAQFPPTPRPEPIVPAGPREPRPPGPGQVSLPDPCQDFSNQPLITLTLAPAEIYREDAITATWDVRDRRPNVQWGYPVHIEAFNAQPAFTDPAPRSSSHRFTTPSSSGHVLVRTRCGERRVNWERIPDAFLEAVSPARGAAGTRVTLTGSQFGSPKNAASRVEIVRGNTATPMDTPVWGNGTIEAVVPNMSAGPATIRVVKGGRRTTLARDFRVVKTLTVNSNLAGLAVASLGLSPGFLHLHHGANASSVALSAAITGGGPSTLNFTIPDFSMQVPFGARVLQNLALPIGTATSARYRVTDLNSNSLSAAVENGRLVLSIGFEGRGREIKGHLRFCYGVGPACVPDWVDDLAPDINVNAARVTLRLVPAASGGALTFPSAEDSFDANIQIGSDLADWLASGLTTWSRDLKTAIRDGVRTRLNTAQVRNAIASAVMTRLRALDPSFNQILSVTPSGGSIVVEYE